MSRQRADRELAEWCVGTGQTPSVYHALTLRQREAFTRAVNRQRGQ